MKRLRSWLEETKRDKITTGKLDGLTLKKFFQHLSGESSTHGTKVVQRSAATINKHKTNVRAMINELADIRPPMFPDLAIFNKALKKGRVDKKPPSVFSPEKLCAFLNLVIYREDPERLVEVNRVRKGKAEAGYQQSATSNASTPLSTLFLLVTLTGCRLGEALALTWDKVDLKRGRITYYATKTRQTRIIPLVKAPEGDVAPRFLDLLRKWREEDPEREFVLPHRRSKAPQSPKKAWEAINGQLEGERIKPQALRQSFCAYASSIGIPATVAALWQGHSSNVAERWYRSQVLDRDQAASIEEAMGLGKLIEEKLLKGKTSREISRQLCLHRSSVLDPVFRL
jgi:integrase